MTVEATTTRVLVEGNGISTVFAYSPMVVQENTNRLTFSCRNPSLP